MRPNYTVTRLSDQLELRSIMTHDTRGDGVVSAQYAVRVHNIETKEEWLVTRGRFYAAGGDPAPRIWLRVAEVGTKVERIDHIPTKFEFGVTAKILDPNDPGFGKLP